MLCLLSFPLNSPSFLSSFLLKHQHPQSSNREGEMHDMETTSQSDQGEEEFIDIEVSPASNHLCPSKSSPPQSREFEFQMSSSTHEKEAATPSPADELFYKGKLLPLHLPPRLQMVEKLLKSSFSPTFRVTQNQAFEEEGGGEKCITPLFSSRSFTAPPTISNTPLESCNISPTESCRVSCELNPDEYFFQWSTEVRAFIGGGGGGGVGGNANGHLSKKTWSKKIRLIKQSSLRQKLKSSRAYLKSLFMKSACSDETNCAKAAGRVDSGEEAWNVSKAKDYVSKYIKLVKRNPFGQMENERHQVSSFTMKSILDGELDDQISFTCHRKSFSGAIKRHCTSKCYSSTSASSASSSNCSSSSSSFSLKSSNGFYEINLLKRSISANSEVENSIEGAIAHCKKSQLNQDSSEEKIAKGEVRTSLLSASSVAVCDGDNGRPEISRI